MVDRERLAHAHKEAQERIDNYSPWQRAEAEHFQRRMEESERFWRRMRPKGVVR